MIAFSFVTTCRGRLDDLRRTLAANLNQLAAGEELVVLCYNDPAAMEWASIGPWSGHERLRCYVERTAPRFFMSHAKNVAHLLGRGRVLVNLDADNYLSAGYLGVLRATDWGKTALLYPRQGSGGFKGRLAVRRDAFCALGGYDQAMDLGYGYEEIDFYRRLRSAGAGGRYRVADVNVAALSSAPACIPTPDAAKAAGQKDPGCPTFQSERQHRALSTANLQARRWVANAGRTWGRAVVYDSAGERFETGHRGAAAVTVLAP